MDDPQLGPDLTVSAGGIDLPETVLPEAPAGWQQRIIIDDNFSILDSLTDLSPLKLPRNLTGISFDDIFNISNSGRFLL